MEIKRLPASQPETMNKINLGRKLKMIRTSNDLSQREFAKKINADQAGVSGWERGERLISTKYLFRIHEVFGISLGVFDCCKDMIEVVL